jgi:hypothetical protein
LYPGEKQSCTGILTHNYYRDLEDIHKEYPSLNGECIVAYLRMNFGHYEVELLLGDINDFLRNFETPSALRYYGKIEDYGNDLIAVYYEDLDDMEDYKWLKSYGAEMEKYMPEVIYSEYALIQYGRSDYINEDLVVLTEEVVNNPSEYTMERAIGFPSFQQYLSDVRNERLVDSISKDILLSYQTNGMVENFEMLQALKSSWKNKLRTLSDAYFEKTFLAGVERFEGSQFNDSGRKRSMAGWYNRLGRES